MVFEQLPLSDWTLIPQWWYPVFRNVGTPYSSVMGPPTHQCLDTYPSVIGSIIHNPYSSYWTPFRKLLFGTPQWLVSLPSGDWTHTPESLYPILNGGTSYPSVIGPLILSDWTPTPQTQDPLPPAIGLPFLSFIGPSSPSDTSFVRGIIVYKARDPIDDNLFAKNSERLARLPQSTPVTLICNKFVNVWLLKLDRFTFHPDHPQCSWGNHD